MAYTSTHKHPKYRFDDIFIKLHIFFIFRYVLAFKIRKNLTFIFGDFNAVERVLFERLEKTFRPKALFESIFRNDFWSQFTTQFWTTTITTTTTTANESQDQVTSAEVIYFFRDVKRGDVVEQCFSTAGTWRPSADRDFECFWNFVMYTMVMNKRQLLNVNINETVIGSWLTSTLSSSMLQLLTNYE